MGEYSRRDKEIEFDRVNALYNNVMRSRRIEPTELRKYTGSIFATKYGTYVANIRHKEKLGNLIIAFSFKTYEKAFRFVKETTKKYGLPVRNKITDYGIYMKVAMTKGRSMIFDRRHLPLIQRHNIHAKYDAASDCFLCLYLYT